jgi:regulatory protein
MADTDITLVRLSRLDKTPDTFNAEFDDGGHFLVNVALIADYSLYSGCVLEEETYKALQKSAGLFSAKKRALRIIGKRQLSRRELTDRLVEKGEDAETASETADWLTDIGALNDTDYAASIVRHYTARGYGIMRIRDELYRRGIDRELWEDALAALPEDGGGAYDFLVSRLKGRKPERDELKRLTDALCRRGFAWEDVRAAISRYMNTEDLLNDD